MHFVLTGASGFFGGHLLRALLMKGHFVTILCRTQSFFDHAIRVHPQVSFCDWMRQDLESVFTQALPITAVIHAATIYGNVEKVQDVFDVNVTLPMKLLTLGIKYNISYFLNVDTFFNTQTKETYTHLATYTLSKRHFQEWGEHLAYAKKINFINARLFHLYGEGDGAQKFVPSMLRQCLSQASIDLTPGDNQRDFICIQDAVDAFLCLVMQPVSFWHGYHHFDIGSGVSTSIRQFVELLHELSGSHSKLNFGVLPSRDGELSNICADLSPLHLLGWEPKISLREGLQSLVLATQGLSKKL